MKKALLIAVMTATVFISCKKKSDNPEETPPLTLEYSKLTVEQHKETLEKNGIDFVAKINTLPDEKAVKSIAHLIDLDGNFDDFSVPFQEIYAMNSAAQQKNMPALFKGATATMAVQSETKASESYGIYTWNSSTKKFDKTASDSKFQISYPATAASQTNNAVFVVTYQAATSTLKVKDELYELPASVTASLKIDGKEELSLNSAYSYKADGTPLATDVNFSLGAFVFKINVKNDLKVVTSTLTINKGTESLINFSSTANGNGNINDIINVDKIGDVLKDANASFEMMNIKLTGVADVKAISDFEASTNGTTEAVRYQKRAEAYNKFSKFAAIYKTENTIIATLEFGVREDPYTYTYWDGTKNVTYSFSDYYIEPKLVFKDGSKLSLETFTDTGFSKLINEFETYGDRF